MSSVEVKAVRFVANLNPGERAHFPADQAAELVKRGDVVRLEGDDALEAEVAPAAAPEPPVEDEVAKPAPKKARKPRTRDR